jgi:hypothetical protein
LPVDDAYRAVLTDPEDNLFRLNRPRTPRHLIRPPD